MIRAYEEKIAVLERDWARLTEEAAQNTDPTASFQEKLEPVLQFLANPWKLWATGRIDARRLVPKLAFAGRIAYDRFERHRTPK